LYLYDIKIQINIKQKFNRKIHGKVIDLFWTGSGLLVQAATI
jgi:hypothetical protein